MIIIHIPAALIPRFSRRTWGIVGAVAAVLVAMMAWGVYTANVWTAEPVADPAFREALIAQERVIRARRDQADDAVTYGECFILKRSLFGIFTQRYYMMPFSYLDTTRSVPRSGVSDWWVEFGVACVNEKREPCELPKGITVTECTAKLQTEGDKVGFPVASHMGFYFTEGFQNGNISFLTSDTVKGRYEIDRFALCAQVSVGVSVLVTTQEAVPGAGELTVPVSAEWQYRFSSRFKEELLNGTMTATGTAVYNA